MRIGIVTILKVNNFGAELQAFALQKKLEMLGFESEVIDYLYYKHPDHIATLRSRPIVSIGFINIMKENILLWKSRFDLMTRKSARHRINHFQQFHRENTKLSPKTYRSFDELYAEHFDYDVFMVGSDQVWNPRTGSSLEPYFLTFAPKGKKTISYASSFGVSTIHESAKQTYTKSLNCIQYLSVREKQGVDIVKHLTGRTAEHVLDPTLLLTDKEWGNIAIQPDVKKPYVLSYNVTYSPYATKLAFQVAKVLGYPLVRIGKSIKFNQQQCIGICDAGPSEFLGLFQNAKYVITNSFHGTVFAVQFHKPFMTIIKEGKANKGRLISFLESLRLSDHIVVEGEAFPSAINSSSDFTTSAEILEKLRSESIDFLLRSITE